MTTDAQAHPATVALTKSQVLKIARNLQAGFSKDTLGAPRSWTEVTKAEQEAWIRTARRAARLLGESQPG